MDRMPDKTAVLLFAGEASAMCGDTDYRFLPDRNFFYLTGLSYEHGKLVIVKRDAGVAVTLYAPVKDAMVERWHGKTASFEELSRISGIDVNDIRPIDDYDNDILELLKDRSLTPATDSASIMRGSKDALKRIETLVGPDNIHDIKDDLIALRMVKSEEEVEAIRQAGIITEAALEDMKEHIRPGVTEIELYAALENGMMKRGCLIPAFATITAIGKNAFYLHHAEPEDNEGETASEGDLIQIDVGARVGGYCADISRVYFVGGEGAGIRSSEERDRRFLLLELILKMRKVVMATIAPGVTFTDLNKKMKEIVAEWMKQNSLTSGDETEIDAGVYYWHNIGHHLGLDVHDCSLGKDIPFEEGNCLAIEPGVYIPEWNAGFRIEDDVLVTKDGCVMLTGGQDRTEDIVIS